MNGIIFDIQTYCIYDGPGIRTTVFLKGCPLRCSWCQNPESQSLRPEISYLCNRCSRCADCVEACPQAAIRLGPEGIMRDYALCLCCGMCAASCHEGATEIIGRAVSSDEIVETMGKDRPFFGGSGGGVTISGGEPTLQADFLLELLEKFRDRGIHTALETCGFFGQGLLESLLPLVDLFLFDIKHIDPVLHQAETGVSNEVILRNFRSLLDRADNGRVCLRVPVVPGFNSTPDAFRSILDFAAGSGYSGPVHLMPYNPLIRTKYERIGRKGDCLERVALAEEDMRGLIRHIEQKGFEVIVER